MSHGALTTQIAHSLHQELDNQGFDVLHDHRQKEINQPAKLGKPRSWFGSTLNSKTLLADLDIAIVFRQDKKIYALIEVEETTSKPKVILGDILATLLGSGIAFQGKLDLQVGDWTTLVVMVSDAHNLHKERLAFLSEQAAVLKEKLTTPNASIGRIIVDSFSSEKQLENKIRQHILHAVNYR